MTRKPPPTVNLSASRAGWQSLEKSLWATFIFPSQDPWLVQLKTPIQDVRSVVGAALVKTGDPISVFGSLERAAKLLSVLMQAPDETLVSGAGMVAYDRIHAACRDVQVAMWRKAV